MAERSEQVVAKPQSAPVYDDVLDDGDTGSASAPAAVIRRTVVSVAPPVRAMPNVDAHAANRMIRVPVAADGTTFSPNLARNGYYTVGAKGAEEKHASFDAALDALTQMDKPRWRRPNAAGNWGIVTGRDWTQIERA